MFYAQVAGRNKGEQYTLREETVGLGTKLFLQITS